MRKIKPTILGTLLLFASCSENITDNISPETKDNTETYFRNYEAALDIAKKQIFGSETRTVSIPKVREHYVYKPSPLTRNVTDTVDVAFHVINFENEQGFAIISADKRAVPVYAYSEEGNINLYDAVEESGWGDFMDMAGEHYVSTLAMELPPFINPQDSVIGGPDYGDIPLLAVDYLNGVRCRIRTTDTYYNYGTRLSTLWSQYSPYNYYYPNIANPFAGYEGRAAAGCAPVAIGQIMAFHEFPLSYQGFTFNWDLIKSKQSYSQNEQTDASLNTALLLRCIADLGNAGYGILTSMGTNGMLEALEAMGYQASVASYTSDILKESFRINNSPIIIGGITNNDYGHVWIVDEYRRVYTVDTYYYDEPPYDIYYEDSSSHEYFHCNWGYGEESPSAYCLNVFEDPNGASFNRNKTIIYDILPDNQ